MRYRIEEVQIPSYRGIAKLSDEARDLPGRRITHILDSAAAPHGGFVLTVVTEETGNAENVL